MSMLDQATARAIVARINGDVSHPGKVSVTGTLNVYYIHSQFKEILMSRLNNLGYEQIKALKILKEDPDMEATELCRRADCSWDELFDLAQRDLINGGADRLVPKRMHPTITPEGEAALQEAKVLMPELFE